MNGENCIGTFNNENRIDVRQIKESASKLIDMIQTYGNDQSRNDDASRYIEIGTMLAVKSIFHELK